MDIDMDIFNLRDDAGCRPRARACGSMPKYGSNASSLVSALANGTAAAKQRMTTAMDSFIAIGWTRAFVDGILCCVCKEQEKIKIQYKDPRIEKRRARAHGKNIWIFPPRSRAQSSRQKHGEIIVLGWTV